MNDRDLFVKAFMEAEEKTNSCYHDEASVNWQFSKGFENKMSALLQPNSNKEAPRTHKGIKIRRLIAAAVAAALILAAAVTAYAQYDSIVQFVEKIKRQYVEVTLDESSVIKIDYIEREYALSSVPEGFSQITYQKEETSVFSVWENESGEQIVFSQTTLGNMSNSIDNEHDMTFLEINGYKAYLTKDNYGALLTWTDGEYWFVLSVPSSLENQILDMQKNILEKN